MSERLEVGYIIIDPDPDPEEYADTITVTKAERHKRQQEAAKRQQASRKKTMNKREIFSTIIGALIGIILYLLMMSWYINYEDPRTPVEQQIWEESMIW